MNPRPGHCGWASNTGTNCEQSPPGNLDLLKACHYSDTFSWRLLWFLSPTLSFLGSGMILVNQWQATVSSFSLQKTRGERTKPGVCWAMSLRTSYFFGYKRRAWKESWEKMEVTFQSRLAFWEVPEKLFSQMIFPECFFFLIRMLIQEEVRKKSSPPPQQKSWNFLIASTGYPGSEKP